MAMLSNAFSRKAYYAFNFYGLFHEELEIKKSVRGRIAFNFYGLFLNTGCFEEEL